MKVGVLQFFSWSRRIPLTTVYERAFSRIEIMDQTGYDCVWLAEHHFSTYSVCPSINVMATHVAARTRHLRIGMAVSLAAFYNPLRLAEEVALVDVLSGGRVNWGAGRGFDRQEFQALGVPPEESSDRFRECVEIVLAAWRNERVSFEGKFWRYDGVEVLPKPLQAPHPPVWLAATSLDSIRRAAEKGFDILQDPHASHAMIGEKRALYYETLRAHGFPTEGRVIPTARLLAVGDSDEEAREVARAGASWTVGAYANPSTRTGPPAPHHLVPGDPVERYMNDVIIHGTPDRVLDTIAELRETIGLDYLMCAPLSHKSFMLFTDKVLPKLI
ncbi:MAG: LLM class flavin-dependent oxidoreductase [Candidatus Rokubacteria bacterium]|nr:LLM class flavin-dependent oxidoreductase [Candidatus Rokubacteria bacterium]